MLFVYFIRDITFVRNEIEKDRKCKTIWSLRLQAMQFLMLPLLNILIKGEVRLNETGVRLLKIISSKFLE